MAKLYVKNIPDDLYREVQKIAASEGHSLSAFVALLFQKAVEEQRQKRRSARALTDLRKLREQIASRGETFDTVDLARQAREGRLGE